MKHLPIPAAGGDGHGEGCHCSIVPGENVTAMACGVSVRYRCAVGTWRKLYCA